MRSRAPLALMEQLIMVLVFALAAAVCIQAFVLADRRSALSDARDHAVVISQSMAEIYKNCRGDAARASQVYGGVAEKQDWVTYWSARWEPADGAEDAAYQIRVAPDPRSAQPGLGRATLSASGSDGLSYTLDLAWQEADENG